MELITLGLSPPETRNILDNPSVPLSSPAAWSWLAGGSSSDSGELVTDQTALSLTTVYSCVRILSESIASLPIKLFKVTPKGRIQETSNPLHYLLSVAPNEEQTAFSFIETFVAHLSLTGNCYAQVERGSDDSPIAFWPLNPRLTSPVRLPNGSLAYKTSDGMHGGQSRILQSRDILHVPLMSWDGLVGLSPVLQAKNAVGAALACERFGARLFANAAVPSLAITTTQKVKPEDKFRMRADWEAMQSGGNQHRIAVLDQDLKLEKLSITPEEAQFLETKNTDVRKSLQFSASQPTS